MNSVCRPLATVIALLVVLTPSVAAQDTSEISGTITTTIGSPIHRARVMVLTADESDTLATMFTDESGRYSSRVATNVAIDPDPSIPTGEFRLLAPFPNPVGEGATVHVRYSGSSTDATTPQLRLYDVLGRRVDPDGSLASGVYFVRLEFSDGVVSEAQSLVIAKSGEVRFSLETAQSELAPSLSSRSAPVAGKQLGTANHSSALAATVRAEKDGFVTGEQSVDLLPTNPATLDFALSTAAAPTADFSIAGSTTEGSATLFDASASVGGSGEDLTYSWDFGDARMGGSEQIAHVYTSAGTFDVALTVTGAYGARHTVTRQVTITAGDPPVSSDGRLLGKVSDVSGFALPDVTVSVVGSELSGTTDAFGLVAIEGVDVGKELTLSLHRSGYANQYVSVGVTADTTSNLYFESLMRVRDAAIEIADAENGFQKRSRDGVMVDMPVDALMMPDGSPASGTVSMSMTPIDVSDADEVGGFPGRFEGMLPTGDDALLLSLGTAEFAFEQDGERLQLAPGKSARVEIPIYTSGAEPGQTIPLWSMDEATGSWVQEGEGTVVESSSSPSGLALAATVGHFSWWNCDKFDNDPDNSDGLCFKWDCTGGLCQKVKVYCWVEGAQKETNGKRRGLEPPVFTARTFFPADGGEVVLPGGREVTIRGTTRIDNVVLQSDTTFTAVAGGNSHFELTLDTVYVAEATNVTLPLDTTGSFVDISTFDIYSFEGTIGQIVGFASERTGGFLSAKVELEAPSGSIIGTRDSDGIASVVQLTETGTYNVIVTPQSATNATYRLQVRSVSGAIQVNSNNEVDLNAGEFRIYQFDPVEGQQLVIGAYARGTRIQTRQLVYDSSFQLVGAGTTNDTGVFEAGLGRHYAVIQATQNVSGPVLFGLSEVFPDAPIALEFGDYGIAEYASSFAYHGQYRYFQFDVAAGDAVELAFYRDIEDGNPEFATFKLFRPDNKGGVASVSPVSGWTDRLISGWSGTMTDTGTYTLLVNDTQAASTGGFTLHMARISPSASIVVDDDLSCTGAMTSSVAAALLAVEDNGSVTVCDGLYESPSRMNLRKDGVTFLGESRDGTIIRFVDANRSPGSVLDVNGVGIDIGNMTLETGPVTPPFGATSYGIYSSNSTNAIVYHDMTVRPFEPTGYVSAAIYGSFVTVAIRNVEHIRGPGLVSLGLDVRATESIDVENSAFSAPVYLRGVGTTDIPIIVDGITVTGTTMEVSNANGGEVRNSTIDGSLTITLSDDITIADNVFTEDSGLSVNSLNLQKAGSALIERNTMARMVSLIAGDGSTVIFRQNRITATARKLEVTHQFNETGGTVEITNNIIDGPLFSGADIKLWYAEQYGSLLFANNTVAPDDSGNWIETVPTIDVSVRDNQFTGDLPLTFVNNVMVGDGTTAILLPAGVSIDSDFNIFSNYAHILSAGTNRTGGNDLTSDAQLTGADHVPQSGSPAIDSGATPTQYAGVPSVDHAGTARPQGAGYDRGAWEQ
ncbi:MAG: PKD domain-containing protein [Bacteroidetes bacterium]|nr:PKD domain-containing protein [Bacteroidota bacterium]